MYNISKEFEFCYGHRVWCQVLTQEHSLMTKCKCRWLHGHQGKVVINLESYKLNDQGMVLDFNELNCIKKFIDDNLDHKFLIDINDPMFCTIIPTNLIQDVDWKPEGFGIVRPMNDITDVERELIESFVILKFVPTSENIAKWLFDVSRIYVSNSDLVKSVQLFETPKSQSTYTKGAH